MSLVDFECSFPGGGMQPYSRRMMTSYNKKICHQYLFEAVEEIVKGANNVPEAQIVLKIQY